MGIVRRIGQNLEAAFSDLLDAAEDPGKALDQTLSELRDQLKLGRRELVRAVAAERRLRDSVESLDQDVQKWERRAELAVRQGDDALARSALQQKRRLEQDKEGAERTRNEQRGAALELKQSLEQMERRFRDFEARRATLVAKFSQAAPNAPGFGAAHAAVDAFDQIAEHIDGIDDVVAAQREVDALFKDGRAEEASLELKFRDLEAQQRGDTTGASLSGASDVDDELVALKQKLRVRV